MADLSKVCFGVRLYRSNTLPHGIRDAVDQVRLLVLFLWPPEKVVDEQNPRIITLGYLWVHLNKRQNCFIMFF